MQSDNFYLKIVFNRATIVTLLAIASGCSPAGSPQTSPLPVSSTATVVSTPSPKASPLPQLDFLARAEDKAFSAQSIARSAQSLDDWNLVLSRWQQAIALLKSVPKSDPKKALAEKKIVEYQRNLAAAQQQAIGISQPKTLQSQPIKSANIGAGCNFLVMGGGGAASYNEIALEKNVLYFQRSLETLGYNPANASVFFANGKDGRATVRYLDRQRQQRFKVPNIPYLKGSATLDNFLGWLQETATQKIQRPIFFYFTGHGGKNSQNLDNNNIILWQEQRLTVQQFSSYLDELPQNIPVVTMMSQCYAGSFANFIYEGGDRARPVSLQTRCGFFATVSDRTSVGCTPEVNEADYKDYSSSFFAGLTGRSRTGAAVSSADYNKDGRVSYAEAHAFAKVDEKTSDWPISTSEAWLQSQLSQPDQDLLLSKPIARILLTARSEQRYVVQSIVKMFNFNLNSSWMENSSAPSQSNFSPEVREAYLTRLQMELIDIGMEQKIRASGDRQKITILNRLIKCEGGSWGKP